MRRLGDYSNKRKMNEFNGVTLVETSHFAIKIVFYCNILFGRRFLCVLKPCSIFYIEMLNPSLVTETLHTITAR
jgi:hypothetical protein